MQNRFYIRREKEYAQIKKSCTIWIGSYDVVTGDLPCSSSDGRYRKSSICKENYIISYCIKQKRTCKDHAADQCDESGRRTKACKEKRDHQRGYECKRK